MSQFFELNSDQIRVRDILGKKHFLEIEIFAISDENPNRNRSHFTLEAMKNGLESFKNKPILGFFNKGDFVSHQGRANYDPEYDLEYWDNSDGEQILGFIRDEDQIEIVERNGLNWIRCTAMICTRYNYKQVKKLLKDKSKKISVEIDIVDQEKVNDITQINKFELLGITILGSRNGVAVREGMEGAHLSILDLIESDRYNGQQQALMFEYSQLENNSKEEDGLAKEDVGTKSALKVNKSKEAMSDTEWGSVDKTELRNRVVAASNFKEIADDVFLDLREGWEDGEVSKLKYPVMQLKDDSELVYNRGGLASAKAYAEKNGEEEVLKKLKSIYEHLDLEFNSEDKYECEDFCEFYEDKCEDCVHEECDTQVNDCSQNEVQEEVEEVVVEDKCEDVDKNCDQFDNDHKDGDGEDDKDDDVDDECGEECPEDHGADEPEDDHHYEELEAECEQLRMKCGDYETKCAEYEAQCTEFIEKCAGYEARIAELEEQNRLKCEECDGVRKELEEANCKLSSIFVAEQCKYIETLACKMKFSEEDIKGIKEKCERKEYTSNEEIDKDMAYVMFQKRDFEVEPVSTQFSTGIVNVEMPKQTVTESRKSESAMDRLRNLANKK